MSKSRVSYALLLITLLLILMMAAIPALGQSATPSGATPSGAPAGRTAAPTAGGPALNLDGNPDAVTPICMTDSFGFVWDAALNGSGPSRTLSGSVDALTGFDWIISGTATKSGGWSFYWRADNPNADGCLSGFTDWFEYFGTGAKSQSGTWTSYCSGSPIASGTWSATVAPGACP